MALVNLERMKSFMEIPDAAETLLTKNEKEIRFSINLRVSPGKIICFDAFVVYHNVVLGPAKGGVRFSPEVSMEETGNLAKIMTYKNALMGLPFGGGKSGIRFDPNSMDDFMRMLVVKEFVHMIRGELDSVSYVPAPDLGSSPIDMATIYGETHKAESVTGKPVRIGGLPGRLQATGRSVAQAAKLGIEQILKRNVRNTKIVIQGFGNVGRWTAYFLHEMGASVIAIADIKGAVYNPAGLDIGKLFEYCPSSKNSVCGFPAADNIAPGEIFRIENDLFIPAAVERVLTDVTAASIKTKMVVEGANDPTTAEGEKVLKEKDIPVLPDFFANSGGVVASYIEWRNAKSGNQTSESEVLQFIDNKMEKVFLQAMNRRKENGMSLRESVSYLALNELIEAMKERAWL